MIYTPLSSVYREAAEVACERCCREYSLPDNLAKFMRSFIGFAYKKVCRMTSIICIVICIAMSRWGILHYENDIEIVVLHTCVTMLIVSLLSVNLILAMQLVFVIPPYVTCYSPLGMKKYILSEVKSLMQGRYYAMSIGGIALLLSFLDTEIWTKEQLMTLYAIYFFIAVGAIWYSILSLRAYIALNDAILDTKRKNEEWLKTNR